MRTELLVGLSIAALGGCAAPVIPPPERALPEAPSLHSAALREPEQVRSYRVGAYVDPDDPTVRHEAHVVHRVESTARWNLQGATAAPPVPRTQNLEELPVAGTRPVAVAPPVRESALEPDASGLIDVPVESGKDASEANPFALKPNGAPREISLAVTGVVGGARPAALINGMAFEPGGVIEGLRVKTVESDAVLLEFGRHRLRVPVSPGITRVRVAF